MGKKHCHTQTENPKLKKRVVPFTATTTPSRAVLSQEQRPDSYCMCRGMPLGRVGGR
jgi:hypothetical protein